MLILHIWDYFNHREKFDDGDNDFVVNYYEEYKYLIFDLITALVAVSLSIWCNRSEPFGARFFYALFALLFSHLYLLWFIIYRLLFGYYTLCGVAPS